jgi:hypothetical protein
MSDNQTMDVDGQQIIERLEERKRKLLEDLAEVEFLLTAAIKHTTKRAYDPVQLAAARAKRKKLEV